MAWPLREISMSTPYTERQPGDYFLVPLNHQYENGETYGDHWDAHLSPQFKASGRTSVLHIRLPGHGGDWSPDMKATDSEGGWTLSGELPNVTASPSINAEGSYHGWLQNGILTDDCEGRTYG